MTKEKTENQIRRIIDEFVTDGSQDQINKLAHVLQKQDADPYFLQELFSRLCCKKDKLFQKSF